MAYDMTAGGTVANRFELSYATIPSQVTVGITLAPIVTSFTRTGYLWHMGNSSTISLRAERHSTGRLGLQGSFTGGNATWEFTDLPPNGTPEVNMTCFITWDRASGANQPVVYYDGVSQSLLASSASSGTPTQTGAWAIGNSWFDTGGTFTYQGGVSEFAIWNRILTAAELSYVATYAYRPNIIANGLVVYCPLLSQVYDHQQTGTITTNGSPGQFRSRPIMHFPRKRCVAG